MEEIVRVNAESLKSFDDIIIIPKGEKRGVKALSELTVLHVVHSPPSDMDHKQVHAGLSKGKFD